MTPKGDGCVTFEHSWGDGVAVMSYFNAVFKDSNDKPAVTSSDTAANVTPKVTKLGRLTFRYVSVRTNRSYDRLLAFMLMLW